MIRGTTPTHIFNIPFDTSTINKVKIIYSQDDTVILTKDTDKCDIKENSVKTTLTQEDTFKFDCKKPVQVQLRVLTKNGEALASIVERVSVSKCLDDEVLT